MNRDEIVPRWRAGRAWLLRTTGPPPRLTPWAWAADVILALLLTIGALSGALRDQDSAGEPARPRVPLIDGQLPAIVPPGLSGPGSAPGPPTASLAPGPIFEVPHRTFVQLLLVALTVLPLVTRRRFPLVSFWIIAIATPIVYDQLSGADGTWTVIALVIAAYSAPTHSRYRNLAVVSVVVAAAWALTGSRDDLAGLPSGLLTFLLLASVGLAANAIHTWRQRAQTMQREHAVATQLAVDRERARLARELHDVVGHNVSVMVVQAGAARKVMDTSPEHARDALLAVEAGGRAAMNELRQVIGLLTADSDGVDLAPQPGLDQLAELTGRVRETGAPVALSVSGTFEALPPGVELTAYRVVQEALTNAVKHAAGAAVTVDVTGTADELRVEVVDTGGAGSTADPGSGRGLAGLRDRLAIYGGTLTAGRRPTGGYRLVAVIALRRSL